MQKMTRPLLVTIGMILSVWVVADVVMVWAWRSRNPWALDLIKRFNKHAVNPVMLGFFGRAGHSAIVHHTGRRSGNAYVTPVIAHQAQGGVIIPLPYGTDVDWLRNLQAEGGGAVELDGRRIEVDSPAVVDIDHLIGLLPPAMARTVRFNGAHEAVRLHVSRPAELASA